MATASQGGIRHAVDGQIVTVTAGEWRAAEYITHQTYRVRVASGYQWLTPDRVAAGIVSLLGIAQARREEFSLRAAADEIARRNLAGPWALIIE